MMYGVHAYGLVFRKDGCGVDLNVEKKNKKKNKKNKKNKKKKKKEMKKWKEKNANTNGALCGFPFLVCLSLCPRSDDENKIWLFGFGKEGKGLNKKWANAVRTV